MNPPNWGDAVVGVVGVLGFVLAVILAVMEIRRYWLPLHLKIQCYRVQYCDNQESVVLFRLSFVNPASAGKTVNYTMYSKAFLTPYLYNKRLDTVWREPDYSYDMNQRTVTYLLPNNECQMPYDEMLQYPLDIPPHQSRTRWYLLIADLASIPLGVCPIQLQAFDVFGKPIASDHVEIPINNLKQVGIYYCPPTTRKF